MRNFVCLFSLSLGLWGYICCVTEALRINPIKGKLAFRALHPAATYPCIHILEISEYVSEAHIAPYCMKHQGWEPYCNFRTSQPTWKHLPHTCRFEEVPFMSVNTKAKCKVCRGPAFFLLMDNLHLEALNTYITSVYKYTLSVEFRL